MKRLLIFLVLLSLTIPVGASTYTENFTLEIPYEGDRDWLNAISSDIGSIDDAMGRGYAIPSTVQTLTATTDMISADAGAVIVSSDGTYALQSIPTIRAGDKIGQELYIHGDRSQLFSVYVQDKDTLYGTNLRLSAVSHDISSNDVLGLWYNGWEWVEIMWVDH